jgi:hypothetical protein
MFIVWKMAGSERDDDGRKAQFVTNVGSVYIRGVPRVLHAADMSTFDRNITTHRYHYNLRVYDCAMDTLIMDVRYTGLRTTCRLAFNVLELNCPHWR